MFCAGEFAENQYTIQGTAIHHRVHSVGEGYREEVWQVRAIWLRSQRYGLVGKADLVESEAGVWRPVEYKRKLGGESENDQLQLCAQALCLEEMTGTPVMRGYLYCAQTRQRREVEMSESLKEKTIAAIASVRRLLETGAMPQAVYSPRCRGCSLRSRCLPKAAAKVNRYREMP